MIGKILWRSFWSWWDNLSYSMFTALMAAVNPSFLVLVPTVAFLLTSDIGFLREYWWVWVIVVCTAIGGMWLWPLSLASHRMHEEMINGPIVGYLKKFWQFTKERFWLSLALWGITTVIGALFGVSLVLCWQRIGTSPFFWGILLFVCVWFFVLFLAWEMVFVILLYKSGMKIAEMLLLALYTVIKYAFVYVVMVGVSWVVYLILLVPAATPFLATPGIMPLLVVVPLVSVYGIGAVIHIWTFRYVFEEVPPQERKRSLLELLTPFVQLWRWVLRVFSGRKR
ncbi:MAG: hypothetical protein N2314_02475 [Brevinematales bacterium]|nr:hypothetical protein [Brevinematales bacterium]